MATIEEICTNYKITLTYIALVVTLIFGFQMYRYFYDAPSNQIKCPGKQSQEHPSAVVLVPVIGVFLDEAV